MSCNYADGLSPYPNKGRCGLPERFDAPHELAAKIDQLASMLRASRHVVVFTGAGISTAAGIPDFRGPRGVWTRQQRGQSPPPGVEWQRAPPTFTHMALVALTRSQHIRAVVTQNIDGLHLRSGLPRWQLSELHGNVFTHCCGSCRRQFVRATPVPTVGERRLADRCPSVRQHAVTAAETRAGRCRGQMRDVVLDWEAALPEADLQLAEHHATAADLALCLGTTLQIVPSGDLPTLVKRRPHGKLVICNLQPTKHDRRADLRIAAYVDQVMQGVLQRLGVEQLEYSERDDPVRLAAEDDGCPPEWTLPDAAVRAPWLMEAVRGARAEAQQFKRAARSIAAAKKRKITTVTDEQRSDVVSSVSGVNGVDSKRPTVNATYRTADEVVELNGSQAELTHERLSQGEEGCGTESHETVVLPISEDKMENPGGPDEGDLSSITTSSCHPSTHSPVHELSIVTPGSVDLNPIGAV